ncbi:hypothetical protein ACS0TY_022107 [Phlomoides rotata]
MALPDLLRSSGLILEGFFFFNYSSSSSSGSFSGSSHGPSSGYSSDSPSDPPSDSPSNSSSKPTLGTPSLLSPGVLRSLVRASATGLPLLMEFLQHYFVAMGQSVNVQMSNFYIWDRFHFYIWDRFQPEWAPMVQKLTSFQLGSLPFIYMGIPLYKGARRKALFDHLCDKMRSMVLGFGDQCCMWFDNWFRDQLLVEVMDFSIHLDCSYTKELVQEIVSVPLRSSGGDVMRWKLTFNGGSPLAFVGALEEASPYSLAQLYTISGFYVALMQSCRRFYMVCTWRGKANTKINNFRSSINKFVVDTDKTSASFTYSVMGAGICGNEEEECLKRRVVASTEIQSDSIEESSLPLVLMVVS